jgi:hypothetical protein
MNRRDAENVELIHQQCTKRCLPRRKWKYSLVEEEGTYTATNCKKRKSSGTDMKKTLPFSRSLQNTSENFFIDYILCPISWFTIFIFDQKLKTFPRSSTRHRNIELAMRKHRIPQVNTNLRKCLPLTLVYSHAIAQTDRELAAAQRK